MPRAFTDEERDRIRERLLEAAREHALAVGLRKMSVATLTRAAGISKGAFYGFFGSKEALIMELLTEAEAQLRARLDAAAAGSGPRDERLRRALGVMFHDVATHPLLRVLADPEELAWLERSLGAEVLAAARADDDRYFGELAGALGLDVSGQHLAGLAGLALAVAVHRDLVGSDRADAVIGLVVDGLVLRLSGIDR
jgi:AcrR family transcriptional regulator